MAVFKISKHLHKLMKYNKYQREKVTAINLFKNVGF